MFGFLKNILDLSGPTLAPEDLTKGTIIDVRTSAEFQGGHVPGSINIPLQSLEQNLNKFRKLNAPLILCCASGNRSGMAQRQLESIGIPSINGGGWRHVNQQVEALSV